MLIVIFYIAITVEAMTAALAAGRRQMDWFGVCVLACVTALGGGSARDVILVLRLIPDLSDGALAGLALLSTFAGNLLLTGSLCNIIVAERAKAAGVRLDFMDFARSGIPMTAVSIAVTFLWLWFSGLIPL
jgi:Na+/H+ antiporter NhaD/arsenite permease-like protein